MLEGVRLLFRILVGWSGLALIIGGLWIVIARLRTIPVDVAVLLVAVTFVLVGVALLWGALNLL